VKEKKIGRNDPCPCGSGKKYKKCCLRKDHKKQITPVESFKVKPKNKPEIVDYHIESKNGGKTWEKKPGLLLTRVTIRPADAVNEEIEELFGNIKQGKFNLASEWGFCRHKLYAVKYHIDNFVSEEQAQVLKFNEDYNPPGGAQMVIENPALIYEMESFLFQVKSSLDVLAVGPLNKIFEFRLPSFDRGKITSALTENENKVGKQKTSKLITIMEKNKDWIEELNEMRVQITHLSQLEGFMCFLRMPFTGGEACTVYYPSMPDGTRAKTYMDSIWRKLLAFYKSVLMALAS
jgi:hypothetical protein